MSCAELQGVDDRPWAHASLRVVTCVRGLLLRDVSVIP